MARTVIGIFDTESEAQDAVQHLQEEGISRSNIDLTANSGTSGSTNSQYRSDRDNSWDSGKDSWSSEGSTGARSSSSTASDFDRTTNPNYNTQGSNSGMGSSERSESWTQQQDSTGAHSGDYQGNKEEGFFDKVGNFFSNLFGNDEDASRYADASRNRAIVTVHTNSMEEAERAADVMDECGAIDVDNQTTYNHATGGMSSGSSFGESTSNLGNQNRRNASDRRSRIFDRSVTNENRLNSDYYNEGPMDNDAFNQKPII